MKIVIVHYHLRPGGVTSVIYQQVDAIRRAFPHAEVMLLVGEKPHSKRAVSYKVVKELNYFEPSSQEEALKVEKVIAKSFLNEITDKETIFHFHNPTLGKNPSLTAVIQIVIDKKIPVFMYCHDFSEDRPHNHKINKIYAKWCSIHVDTFLYPDKYNVTYLTINSYDASRDQFKGLKKSKVTLLPPPVQKLEKPVHHRGELSCWLNIDSNKEWLFYPIRAIKRKNIAEVLLLAILDNLEKQWLIAREPINPQEKDWYQQIVDLSKSLHLPIIFDAANIVDFIDLMYSSDKIVTTSIKEGFGMAFLEPWYIEKPVIGRELPTVVDDMRYVGVLQDYLYSSLLVPTKKGTWADFGTLDDDYKITIIKAAFKSEEFRNTVIKKNHWWDRVWGEIDTAVVENNIKVIEREYSVQAFSDRLKNEYLGLLNTTCF